MMDYALPLSMAGLTFAGILSGYRVAFVLAGTAALFILIGGLPAGFFQLIVSRIYANVLSNWLLVAIPMFIFMGHILEKSGVAERSLRSAQAAFGGSPAAMGLSVLIVGLLLAASSGIVGASVVLISLLALPRLLEAGYDKSTSAGLIASSGTLAILIPPSVMLIVLGDQLQTSVPAMFGGAIGPGLLLVALYAAYIVLRVRGSGVPVESTAFARRARLFIIDVGPLLLLVFSVLGSIIGGLATPTEASGVGAFAAILIAAFYGRLRTRVVMNAARDTVVTTSVVMMVMVGATCFSAVFKRIGGDKMILDGLEAVGGGPWTLLAIVMLAIFLLGFVLDWLEITLILMPIFAPIIAGLDFGLGLSAQEKLVWFGILVAVNLQTSFLTPPFGFSLFYLRGAVGDQISTKDIYRGVVPFILLQLIALGVLMAFPQVITSLL